MNKRQKHARQLKLARIRKEMRIRKVKRKLLGEPHVIRADARVKLDDWWKYRSQAPGFVDWLSILRKTFDEYTDSQSHETEGTTATPPSQSACSDSQAARTEP